MTDVFQSLRIDRHGDFVQVPKYPRALAWLLRLLQRRCKHWAMKADICEGSAGIHQIRWCETCGAILPVIDGTPCGIPRMCEPTWERR